MLRERAGDAGLCGQFADKLPGKQRKVDSSHYGLHGKIGNMRFSETLVGISRKKVKFSFNFRIIELSELV